MIIQCEQCQTKFRLDDSKVKDTGVKVRCARCRNVFSVSKEEQESVPPSDFGAIFDQNAALMDEAQPFDPFAAHDETASGESPTEYDFDSSYFDSNKQEESTTTIDSTLFDLPDEEPLPVTEANTDFSQFALDEDQEPTPTAAEAPLPESEIKFGGFDFGEVPEPAEGHAEEVAPFSDFDFTPSDSAAPLDIDLHLSDFSGSDASLEASETSESASTTNIDETFNLGEIDFGDELASLSNQQVNPDEMKGGLDFDFGHLDEPQETTSTYASGGGATWVAPVQAAPLEQRPVSVESEEARPKQKHLVTILLSVAAVFAMAIAIYMSTSPSQELTTPSASETGTKPVPESGKITLTGVDAAFINNKKTGELLVITGTAVNSYNTTRAAILIKGMVYGDNDEVVASKNAFCGNMLTKEQLATVPMDTIEAAMANQLGGALENLGVAPGKTIPCMVVINKLPANSKNYGAVPGGSQPVKAQP